jgi:dihydrofolate reductase
MKPFSIIVAVDAAGGIGMNGVLPWHYPEDLRHFKEITTGKPGAALNILIMGRKTWESIPLKFRPLPGRKSVVISGQADYVLPVGVERSPSFDDALGIYCRDGRIDSGEVFVIGGASIFAQAIVHPLCRHIYLTRIDRRYDCDVFFPEIPSRFKTLAASGENEEKRENLSFVTLTSF